MRAQMAAQDSLDAGSDESDDGSDQMAWDESSDGSSDDEFEMMGQMKVEMVWDDGLRWKRRWFSEWWYSLDGSVHGLRDDV